jgi:acyl-CoA thioester hydrolase
VVSHRLGKVAAEGEALIVAYDYSNATKTALTAADREAIALIEGGEPPPMEARR